MPALVLEQMKNGETIFMITFNTEKEKEGGTLINPVIHSPSFRGLHFHHKLSFDTPSNEYIAIR